MIVAGEFSFNNGKEFITNNYPEPLEEVYRIIGRINADEHKIKESKEKTIPGQMLYSPSSLNQAFKNEFYPQDWVSQRVKCEYPTEFYTNSYSPAISSKKPKPFREMDFIKDGLGVEVQFGKYAFMVYNVCAKMTIFRNLGFIHAGIEIVPVKEFADEMSTGVSYFEQFVWDLQQRGVADIDIPVLILDINQ